MTIRELRANLSHCIKRMKAGEKLTLADGSILCILPPLNKAASKL